MTLPEGTVRYKKNFPPTRTRTKFVKVGKDWIYEGSEPDPNFKDPVYPPVNLPDWIKPTQYKYYYISKWGVAYREPRYCDRNGRFGEVNEWGLIELNPHLRGNKYKGREDLMYLCVNIYFYDDDGKNIDYKKVSIHQLVAQEWVPNPNNYTEVLHGDRGNRCNEYTNIRWGTHKENMSESVNAAPEGTIRKEKGTYKRVDGGITTYHRTYQKINGEWELLSSVRK